MPESRRRIKAPSSDPLHADRRGIRLRLHLLGPPAVTWDDQPLVIMRRQPRALLYRLASQLQPVAREQLHFLFWPDHDERAARRGLTQAIYLLHEALGQTGVLIVTDERVSLDPQLAWSDTAEFARLSERAGSSADPDAPALTERHQQAVDLYRGAFLTGVAFPNTPEFDSWLSQERRDWENLYLANLELLCRAAITRGDLAAAIAFARRYLATDELAEPMHRRLIELYAQSGDRPAAIRQFERCMILLERELGTSPMAETRTAYQHALAGHPIPVPHPPGKPAVETQAEPELPLVGRELVVRRLQTIQAAACAGQGGIVLITGEPGIGKTRLMREVSAAWQPAAAVIEGAGRPQAQALPYQPLVQALRGGAQRYGSAWLDGLPIPAYWLAEAARLLPELPGGRTFLAAPAAAEPADARSHLFEALSQVMLGLATPQLVVLCLDDLHWADGATLDWLAHVAHYLASNKILVIGTVRSEDLPRLAGLRHTLRRQRVLTELPLQGLDRTGVRDLLVQMHFDDGVAAVWADHLVQATGGNPFFILETVRALGETARHQPPLDQEAGARLPLPDSVRAAVDEHLQHVTPLARQVLEASAVLGTTFEFDLLLATAGRSELETVDALEELIARHLLIEQTGHYHFSHEIVQSVVYQQLSFGRRRILHRRAGDVLEKRYTAQATALQGRSHEPSDPAWVAASWQPALDADLVAQLARHFSAGGDINKAVVYLLHAGDLARGLYAYPEAIQAYRQALGFLQEIGEFEQGARTLMKLALTYHVAFDYAHARTYYEQGFALWQHAAKRAPPPLPPAPHALRINWPEPTTLDPGRVWDTYTSTVVDQLFRGLVERTTDLEIVPAVARAWEILDEGRRYLFHLRDDVCWSDGQPVTAADFVYAWRRVLTSAAKTGVSTSVFSDIKGAQAIRDGQVEGEQFGAHAVDACTLVIELEQPTSYFLQLMACSICYPVPQHLVTEYGDAWAALTPMAVNGPFRAAAWVPGERLQLVRNPDYFGRISGNVQQIDLLTAVTPETGLEAYAAGQLDVFGLWNLPAALAGRARSQYASEYVSFPALETWFLQFDCSQVPFADTRVRQALALAVNRERLVDAIPPARGLPANGGLVPPGMPQHAPGAGLPYRPGQARRLLAEAGYDRGEDFPIVNGLAFPGCEPLCEFITAQWQESLQVRSRWEIVPFNQLAASLMQQTPGARITAWTADYPDPDNFLREVVRRPYGKWHHARYDTLVDEARRIIDPDRRMALYSQAETILIAEAAIVPLMYGRQPLLLKPWIKRFPSSAIEWWFWKDVVIAR